MKTVFFPACSIWELPKLLWTHQLNINDSRAVARFEVNRSQWSHLVKIAFNIYSLGWWGWKIKLSKFMEWFKSKHTWNNQSKLIRLHLLLHKG